MQTPPFQRLRRIRQLGFSEFVFQGATHTRFAHSIGVFHVARQLMRLIERYVGISGRQYKEHQAYVVLAAALVHDVGHGMFSHAFEKVGKALNLPLAHHETVSERLIRESEIAEEFRREHGSGFADDVADVIAAGKPGNLYDAVGSSQFDADRLDYMRRDRMMTGVESSGIDATWLSVNLEVASVRTGADDEAAGRVETLILGPKSFYAAENYVLSLFQLYPNVYFHKATKSAEKVFSALMLQLVGLVRDGHGDKTGLPSRHPIRRFVGEPDRLHNVVALDDTVFWGALPTMMARRFAGYSPVAISTSSRHSASALSARAAAISGRRGRCSGPARRPGRRRRARATLRPRTRVKPVHRGLEPIR
jgi:HD superfamily phosphohydrolase